MRLHRRSPNAAGHGSDRVCDGYVLEIPYSEIIIAAAFPSFLYFGLFMQIDATLRETDSPRRKIAACQSSIEGRLVLHLRVRHAHRHAALYAARSTGTITQPPCCSSLIGSPSSTAGASKTSTSSSRALGFVRRTHGYSCRCWLDHRRANADRQSGQPDLRLVSIAGDSVMLLLIMGAVTSFILGIGMTVTAAYLFLAVTVAPALTQGGLNPLAVHLFMMYWGMISFITPPVAIGAYAAASVANRTHCVPV